MTERVVGRIPVLECLRAAKRSPRRLFLLEDSRGLEAIRDAAGTTPVAFEKRKNLDALSGGVVHQGVVLDADPLPLRSIEDWCSGPLDDDALIVVLDGVEDPHNFGAIVRSAAAFGAAGVVFGKDRAAPISPASVKSAAGAMEHIDLVRVTNLVRALKILKDTGFWVTGLDAAGSESLWETDLSGKTALVVGSEGKGMRRLMKEQSDHHVRIDLAGAITSLNASTAAAVALAECRRQRAR